MTYNESVRSCGKIISAKVHPHLGNANSRNFDPKRRSLRPIEEIEVQGRSLNPGHYVGVAEGDADDFGFKARLEELKEELETLNVEASKLEDRISENMAKLL